MTKVRKAKVSKSNYMSDEMFADLKEALKDYAHYPGTLRRTSERL